MKPLFDTNGRIVAIGTGTATSAVVDALLRLHTAKQKARPITVYIVGVLEEATQLPAGDALLLANVLRTINSPVRTVGMGLLTSWQAVLLACGTPGQRYVLSRSLVMLGPLEWNGLGLPKPPIGLHVRAPITSPVAIEPQLHQQLQSLLAELNLAQEIFLTPGLLNARQAIENRLADKVFDRHSAREFSVEPTVISKPSPTHEPEH